MMLSFLTVALSLEDKTMDIGFDWDYWHSMGSREAPHRWFNESHIIQQHQYTPSQLQVSAHFHNLKEEVLEFIGAQGFGRVVEKTERLLDTDEARDMRADRALYIPSGIAFDSCVTAEHVQTALQLNT